MVEEATGRPIPDAVLAVIVQFILGICLASSAVPQTVLSLQDRGSETMGVLFVILVTATVAYPVRSAWGEGDSSKSEYLIAVLTPLVLRLDLGLLIWVHVNKSLVWVEQMLFVSPEEVQCAQLLLLASKVWHNGDERIFDPEFGFHGGHAAVVMRTLQRDYNPRNISSNFLAWFGHITLWPFAMFFHVLLLVVHRIGFVIFSILSRGAWMTVRRKALQGFRLRGSFTDFLLNRRGAQSRKMQMRPEVASLIDSNVLLLKAKVHLVRHRWAMLGTIDAILQHSHFKRLLSISYPMRAPIVYKRVLADSVSRNLRKVLDQELILFKDFGDNPMASIGEEASRQTVEFRVMGWPPASEYSGNCLRKMIRFADENCAAWKDTEQRFSKDRLVLAEFISVRDILRRYLVQLVVLAWCDGLGECWMDESVTSITEDLSKHYIVSKLAGIEMAVRLINLQSTWNDARQMSSMVQSLTTNLPDCGCQLCLTMEQERRLTIQRYSARPSIEELGEQLRENGCQRASGILGAWNYAVRKWIGAIFEAKQTV